MATYHVATTGNNANGGTSLADAKLTIAAGIALLTTAGDILYIHGGTYTETDVVMSGKNGSSGNVITIQAYPGDTVTWFPASGTNILNIQSCSYITVKADSMSSFVFNAFNVHAPVVATSSVSNIRFEGLEIKDSGLVDGPQDGSASQNSNGITAGGTNIEIINCYIHGCGYGLYVSGTNLLVDGCRLTDNWRHGIHRRDEPSAGYATIRNNMILDNGQSGWQLIGSIQFGPGIGLHEGDPGLDQVYNNVFARNWSCGLYIRYDTSNAQVYNNTFYANNNGTGGSDTFTGSGIVVGEAAITNTIIRNNAFYLGVGTNIQDDGTATIQDHNSTANPIFVDAANDNFRLQSISPNINAGTDVVSSILTTDLDGNPRTSVYDIGAFEYQPATPPTNRTLIASDSFAGSSLVALGGNWQQLNTSTITMYRNASGQVTSSPTVSNLGAARWVAAPFMNDQYSSLEFRSVHASTQSAIGVCARASGDIDGARDFYFFVVARLPGVTTSVFTYFGKVVNGVEVSLADQDEIIWVAGDRIELECSGTIIRAMRSGVPIFTVTDSSIGFGAPGVVGTGNFDGIGDNWEGGNIGDVISSIPAHKGRRFTFLKISG